MALGSAVGGIAAPIGERAPRRALQRRGRRVDLGGGWSAAPEQRVELMSHEVVDETLFTGVAEAIGLRYAGANDPGPARVEVRCEPLPPRCGGPRGDVDEIRRCLSERWLETPEYHRHHGGAECSAGNSADRPEVVVLHE